MHSEPWAQCADAVKLQCCLNTPCIHLSHLPPLINSHIPEMHRLQLKRWCGLFFMCSRLGLMTGWGSVVAAQETEAAGSADWSGMVKSRVCALSACCWPNGSVVGELSGPLSAARTAKSHCSSPAKVPVWRYKMSHHCHFVPPTHT